MKRVYILEYDLYNQFGKYDEKNKVQRNVEYFTFSERQNFIKKYQRVINDEYYYDNIECYGYDYEDNKLDMDNLIKNM